MTSPPMPKDPFSLEVDPEAETKASRPDNTDDAGAAEPPATSAAPADPGHPDPAAVRRKAVAALFLSTPPGMASTPPAAAAAAAATSAAGATAATSSSAAAGAAHVATSAEVAAATAVATGRAMDVISQGTGANWMLIVGALVLAVIFHGGVGVGTSSLAEPKPLDERVEMAIFEPPPPPPPPEPEIEEPEPEKPKPEPKKKKLPETKVKEKPAEPPPEPPPSNSDPEPVDEEPPPLVTGISMESTTKGNSGFKVRVGNTAYGDPNKEKFTDPDDVKKYRGGSAKKFKPVRQASISTPPTVIKRSVPRYPKQLKDEGIEGVVVLKILIDEDGRVRGTKVIKGLHPVLDKLARAALKKTLFSPCKVDGKPVTCPYTYRFKWEIYD